MVGSAAAAIRYNHDKLTSSKKNPIKEKRVGAGRQGGEGTCFFLRFFS